MIGWTSGRRFSDSITRSYGIEGEASSASAAIEITTYETGRKTPSPTASAIARAARRLTSQTTPHISSRMAAPIVTPTAKIQMGVSQIVSFDMCVPGNEKDQVNKASFSFES